MQNISRTHAATWQQNLAADLSFGYTKGKQFKASYLNINEI